MKRALGIVLALALTAAKSSSTYAGWFGYDSYDECMVEEMRGQSSNMLLIVSKYCGKQFPRPMPPPTPAMPRITYDECMARRSKELDAFKNTGPYKPLYSQAIIDCAICCNGN